MPIILPPYSGQGVAHNFFYPCTLSIYSKNMVIRKRVSNVQIKWHKQHPNFSYL